MVPEQFHKIHRQHYKTINKIVGLMEAANLKATDGEAILLYLAGLSAGSRQAPCNGTDWLLPITYGWKFAAEHAD